MERGCPPTSRIFARRGHTKMATAKAILLAFFAVIGTALAGYRRGNTRALGGVVSWSRKTARDGARRVRRRSVHAVQDPIYDACRANLPRRHLRTDGASGVPSSNSVTKRRIGNLLSARTICPVLPTYQELTMVVQTSD